MIVSSVASSCGPRASDSEPSAASWTAGLRDHHPPGRALRGVLAQACGGIRRRRDRRPRRRDFTVNSMAVDTADGTLIDPYGGREDLAARVLRTPLDPTVSFGDDPLRMLRAARFIASHGLLPDDALVGAVQAMAGRLDIVAVERVRDEFEKLLLLDDPSEGFRFLFHTGLIGRVVADLTHRDPSRRWVASSSLPWRPSRRIGGLRSSFATPAEDRGRPPASGCAARTLWSRPSTGLIAACARLAETSGSRSDVRRFVHTCRVPVDAALAFAEAVATASRHSRRIGCSTVANTLAELRSIEDVDNFALPVDGNEVMAVLGLGPGPEVGRALAFLRERAFEHGPPSKARGGGSPAAVAGHELLCPDREAESVQSGHRRPDGTVLPDGSVGATVDYRLARAATLKAWKSGTVGPARCL